MERLIMREIKKWYDENERMCLLIDGARQVGKSYIINEFGKRYCKSFLEVNLLENKDACRLLSRASSTEDILRDLDVLFPGKLVPHETVVFFDEVQECPDIVTAVKFLVLDARYRYILSGSLLGVEYENVRSMPVGYMQMMQMYPLSFAEFLMAYGVTDEILEYLRDSFTNVKPMDEVIHNRIMSLFRQYLIVGGMPAAVQRYLDVNTFSAVREIHEHILNTYRADIAKYDRSKKPQLIDIFDAIPEELNSQTKRFNYATLDVPGKTSFIENSFLWLTHAGVAIPVYNVEEPRYPLRMSKSHSLLKLFMNDVGLLDYAYFSDNVQVKILTDDSNVNFGAVYENYVAQELVCNGVKPYYFKSNNMGELDFVVEINSKVVPLEVKSGKDYHRHNALNKIMSVRNYSVEKAYVFNSSGKIETDEKRIYMPIYMAMFLKDAKPETVAIKRDNEPWVIPDRKA
ncbi:MAG: AAA family ATPase [Clostridia bacterium]|nr:AAA family ATPase [Clostridia bacterium]